MLWNHYVYRRKHDVFDLWDAMFIGRRSKLLYIAGRGFDVRAQYVLDQLLNAVHGGEYEIEQATLLLVGFQGYELSDELQSLTQENTKSLHELFEKIGSVIDITLGGPSNGNEEMRATSALRSGIEQVIAHLDGYTDIILDVSSLPRVMYLSLMTGILSRLVVDKSNSACLAASGVNFQILVAENAGLDSHIRSEDPSDELVLIPGFGGALYAESVQDWPLVWFPMLGENRTGQFDKIAALANIPDYAEICPILPHPSLNPRRADDLLMQFRHQLFDARGVSTTNILLAHESNPFEAYRQLLRAMKRYKESLSILGGCRLWVTPLSSKLMTLAAGLACFEMRPAMLDTSLYGVAIPYAEPKRYVADVSELRSSTSELSALLLTGSAYAI
ncbi:MAG: hypothetical protein Q8O19_01410 [Rectinemataceae bacterium]|nr:hypothetical protein [Rectinemataceae bacterium]